MFKINKISAISHNSRLVTCNASKFFSDKFTPSGPFDKKPEVESKLPCVVKNEDIKLHNVPYVGIPRYRNPITVPMMMSSFFSKSFNDLAKELLFYEPLKSIESPTISNKQPFNTSAEFSEGGMTIAIEMKGFKEDDINVRVEGPWLVVEGQSTVSVPEQEGGGLHVRHVIRRYEVPPNSDVANIKSSFKSETLTITVPSLTPKLLSGRKSHGTTPGVSKPTLREYSTSNKSPGHSLDECRSLDTKKEEKKAGVKKLSMVSFSDKGMYIFIDIKGFTKDDVNIQVEGTMLKIVVSKLTLDPKKKAKNQKTLYRRYPLPLYLNLHKITAEIKDDFLKIVVPPIEGKIEWKEPSIECRS